MAPFKLLAKLVQFMARGSLTSCTICFSLVAPQDQQGHRQWHANNKETTR